MNRPALIILFLLMTFLGSYGSLLLKKSTQNGVSIFKLLKNIFFYCGGFSYFLSAVINIILLKYINYTIMLPLTSVTYIWSLLLAYFVLKENLSKEKIIGMTVIGLGILLIVPR